MSKPNLKHLQASVHASASTLESLAPWLPEMLRRREHDASDGYPASSMGESGSSGTVSDPTQRAALTPTPEDRVAVAIDTIVRLVMEVDELCRSIRGSHRFVIETGDSERGRQSTIKQCGACDRTVTGYGNDRLWAGYCRTHYDPWRAYAAATPDPSHVAFRNMVRDQLTNSPKRNAR